MKFDPAKDFIRSILIEPTWRCANNCAFCYIPGLRDWVDSRVENTPAQIITGINRLVTQTGVTHYCFTGGEPLMRRDLVEIIAGCSDLGCASSIITSGYSADERKIKKLVSAGLSLAQVSLHAYDSLVHDGMVRREGSHREAVSTLLAFAEQDVPTCIDFVATSINHEQFPAVVELASTLGVKEILFNRIVCGGSKEWKTLSPSPEQLRQSLISGVEIMRASGIHVHPGTPLVPCLVDMKGIPEWENRGFCPLGDVFDWNASHFTVDPYGNLRPCNLSYVVLGNILHDDFVSLMQRMKLNEFIGMPEHCQGCDLEHSCGGGCKADYTILNGRYIAGDPYLPHNLADKSFP